MKIEFQQELILGRLTVTMSENCHGDSRPVVDSIHFNRFHEKISPDTAALAGAIIAARWCGEVLEFSGSKINGDVAEAVRLIAVDAKFVQPIDGYRRNLCEGQLDLLVSPAVSAAPVLNWTPSEEGGLTRLLTWNGEFVSPSTRSSDRHLAGEVSTNADVLLPAWETSVCLGLLMGGLKLGSIVITQPGSEFAPGVERIVNALRIIGVHVRAVAPAFGKYNFTENSSTRINGEKRLRLQKARPKIIDMPALTVENNLHGNR